MTVRLSAIALVFAAAGLVAAGCGNGADTATDGRLNVMASFYPLAYVVEEVGGDAVDVTNLTAPGAEPHDLELSPRQVGSLNDADLIIYLKGFQPAVDTAVEQSKSKHVLDAASIINLGGPVGADPENTDNAEHPDEQTAEANADDAPDHSHSLGEDPHFWLDPTKLAEVTEHVADDLASIDPGNADAYRQRATALTEKLTALDNEYEDGLAQCERRVFVTSHEAFGHLADRYDLEMVGISGLDPDAEPSPARLAEVQQIVKSEGVTTIFYERLVSPKVADVLASDLDLETAVLDPIEGLTDQTEGDDYMSLMEANLRALQKANGCQ